MGRQDEGKKWRDKTRDKKNREKRCKTKKIEDVTRMKKIWGDKMQDKKNVETRCETEKKRGDETRDKKNGKTRPV